MINYGLPKTVEIDGNEYEIRSDYRANVVLTIFYPDIDNMPTDVYETALQKCFDFIECGKERDNKSHAPKLVDWAKDFQYIIAPINAVAGREIRADEYLHWWTFIGYYNEINGDCTFAQIVRIRDKQARGKKLDKDEREWLNRNMDLVVMPSQYTEQEEELLKMWGGQNG